VINGEHGNGFSCQASLPDILESLAAQIRKERKSMILDK
jgi:hypothetical protein